MCRIIMWKYKALTFLSFLIMAFPSFFLWLFLIKFSHSFSIHCHTGQQSLWGQIFSTVQISQFHVYRKCWTVLTSTKLIKCPVHWKKQHQLILPMFSVWNNYTLCSYVMWLPLHHKENSPKWPCCYQKDGLLFFSLFLLIPSFKLVQCKNS